MIMESKRPLAVDRLGIKHTSTKHYCYSFRNARGIILNKKQNELNDDGN